MKNLIVRHNINNVMIPSWVKYVIMKILIFFRLVEVRNRMNGKAKLTVVSTKNIKLKNFADYYAKLRNSPHILKIEFNELNEITAKYDLTDNVAKRYDNYRKNRYVNVVPCTFHLFEFLAKIQTRFRPLFRLYFKYYFVLYGFRWRNSSKNSRRKRRLHKCFLYRGNQIITFLKLLKF